MNKEYNIELKAHMVVLQIRLDCLTEVNFSTESPLHMTCQLASRLIAMVQM